MNSTLTIRIPKQTKIKLERLAKEGGTPISEMVRESLERVIAVRQFDSLRRKTLKQLQGRSSITDEDVMKLVS